MTSAVLPTGTGRYEPQAVIGHGGFALVVRAHDRELDSSVALKILAENWAGNEEIRARFMAEARLLRRVRDEHVVAIHDVGELDDGRPYFVMEYADRGPLEARIESTAEPDRASVVAFVDALVGGLGALHAEGIVHRDVNPRNLLLRSASGHTGREPGGRTAIRLGLLGADERLMIGDLGLAKDVWAGVEASVVGGSAHYQAPEQLDPRGHIGIATDTYGASAVLWRLLTGTPPPLPSDLATALATVHGGWRDLFARALALESSERFDSMESWRQAVLTVLDDQGDGEVDRAVSTFGGPVSVAACPFKGLAAFQADDAGVFFGRESLVEELVRRLATGNVLVIGGPSGSGKSSLTRAGLIPNIRAGAVLGSEHWPISLMTPGVDPLGELAHQLARHAVTVGRDGGLDLGSDPQAARRAADSISAATGGLLLCIDQFEEIFTLTDGTARRRAFLDALESMTDPADSQVRLVVVIRADFYGSCATDRWLAQRITDNQVLVGPMARAELKRAIELPAVAAGLRFEEGLVDRILDDAGDEPGSLPLVAHALVETWKRRVGTTMTLGGYSDAGGVAGAIAQTADDVYGRLDRDEAELTRRLFLRLVNPGDGTGDTRRRVDWGQAIGGGTEATARSIISLLTEERLLTVGESSVEIAHEALLRSWPRLRGWIDESRDALRQRQRLEAATAEWNDTDRDIDLLLRGTPLANAIEWVDDHPDLVSPSCRAFIEASDARRIEQLGETERAERRVRRVRRSAIAVLATITVVAIVASLIAWRSSGRASDNARKAEVRVAQTMAAQALQLAGSSPRLALALATESLARGASDVDGLTALVSARAAEQDLPLVPSTPSIDVGDALSVAIRPDGGQVATGGRDGTIRLWDSSTGDGVGELIGGHAKSVEDLRYTPDGTSLLSAGGDRRLVRWSLEDPAEAPTAFVLLDDDGPLWSLDVSSDGSMVAVGSEAGHVAIVDLSDASPTVRTLVDVDQDTTAVEFSPDGSSVAWGTGSGLLGIADAKTGAERLSPFAAHDSDIWEIVYTPDADSFATASSDGEVRVFDTATGRARFQAFPDSANVRGVQIFPDGRLLVGGDESGGVGFWSLEDDAGVARLPMSHRDQVLDAALSADGRTLATLGRDQSLQIWDEAEPAGLSVPLDGDGVLAVAADPSGEVIAATMTSGAGTLVRSATGERVREFAAAGSAPVRAVAFSPDGERIVTGDDQGVVRLFETQTGALVTEVTGHESRIWDVVFSADGGEVISAAEDGSLAKWSSTQLVPGDPLPAREAVFAMSLSPEGRMLATAGEGTVSLIDLDRGSVVQDDVRIEDNRLWDIEYSDDGERLAVASDDEVVEILASADLSLLQSLTPHARGATSVAFAGSVLATLSRSGIVQLWDAAMGTRLGPALPAHVDDAWRVISLPGSDLLVSSSEDGTIVVWDALDVGRACELIGSVFDDDAQRRYLGAGVVPVGCDGRDG